METINLAAEYKAQIKRLQQERDLYRERAIDEVADHHKDATRTTATLDVDMEVMRHLQGVRS